MDVLYVPHAPLLLFPGTVVFLLFDVGVTGYASGHWLLGAVGAVLPFLGPTPFQSFGGCLACACDIPAGSEYWRHIGVGFTLASPGRLRPAVRVTAEPFGCIYGCPYFYLPVVPLLPGYGSIAVAVLSGRRERSGRTPFA